MAGNHNSGRKREYLRIADFEPVKQTVDELHDEVHLFLYNHWPTFQKDYMGTKIKSWVSISIGAAVLAAIIADIIIARLGI